MADNISVSITADATQLRSQLAMAQADLRAYGAEVRSTASTLRTASDDMRSGLLVQLDSSAAKYNTAKQSVTELRNALGDSTGASRQAADGLEKTAEAATHAHGGTAGITRELIVLGHEALIGNYNRIPGSLMVLAERSGAATNAIAGLRALFTPMGIAATAAIGGIIASLAILIVRAHEAETALRGVYNAALLAGRGAAEAEAHAKDMAASMTQSGQIGSSAALQLASGIERIGGISTKTKEQIAALAPALKQLMGEDDVKKTVEALDRTFSSAEGLKKFVDENSLLASRGFEQIQREFDAAVKRGDLATAAEDAMKGLNARVKPGWDEYVKQSQDAGLAASMAAVAALDAGSATLGQMGPVTKPLRIPELGTKAPPPEELEAARAVDRETAADDRLAATKRDLELITQRQAALTTRTHEAEAELANASTEGARQAAQAKLEVARANERDAATAKAHTEEEIKLHQEQMDTSWLRAQEPALEKITTAIKLHGTNAKQIAKEVADAEFKYWTDISKQAGLSIDQIDAAQKKAADARERLLRDEQAGAGNAAKQALEAKLATLSEEQAANKDNFNKVMELEAQKLELLKSAGAKYTAEYERELIKRDNLEREHRLHVLSLDEEGLAKARQVDTQEIAEKRADLEEEVTLHGMTKQQELSQLKAFIDEKRALEDLMRTLDQESDAYKRLADALKEIKAKWAVEDKQINREAARDMQTQMESAVRPITSAFETSFNGVIQGTQTVQQAIGKMAQSVVLSYAKMAIDALGHWVASQVAQLFITKTTETEKTATTATGAATRTAITNTEGNSGIFSFLRRVVQWITGETTMTAATATNEAARTGAVAAGEAARTATQVAAKTAGAAAQVAAGSKSIINSAYQAAAHTYASVAAIPIVGWVLAPAAAAVAFAAVMAFNAMTSLATGAWDIPGNMAANLHAGEMVVPASFASGLRSSLGTGAAAAGGGGTTLNYSPNVSSGGSPDLSSMMKAQANEFKSYLWQIGRNGNLNLPGRAA